MDQTTFNYYLDQQQTISIGVYDMTGKLVKSLLTNTINRAGNHKIDLSVTDIPAGAYLISMQGESFVLSENLLIVD